MKDLFVNPFKRSLLIIPGPVMVGLGIHLLLGLTWTSLLVGTAVAGCVHVITFYCIEFSIRK